MAHAGAARHLPERERPVLLLGDQLQRRLDQRATQVPVVVGLGFGAANFFSASIAPDIDTGYILMYPLTTSGGRMSTHAICGQSQIV